MTTYDTDKAQQTMETIMRRVNTIGRAIEDREIKRAHDLRDGLFSYVALEISRNVKVYTKRDIHEMVSVLVGVDESWGI